jgi:endoglucanase
MNTLNRLSAALIVCLMFSFLACSKEHSNPSENNHTGTDTSAAPTAASVILSMGTGFNLGNTFDLSLHSTSPESITPIIDLYYSAGLRHIRIPITWMEDVNGSVLANANGIVNFQHPRFVQLEAVIRYALDKKMYVVINAHHERSFKEHYDGSAHYDSIFHNLWHGIADHFKDYSDHLIFDVLNEPEGAFGDWNGGPTPNDPQALAFTRHINEVGCAAIRETGGKNRTRIVMVELNAQGNQSQIEEVYPDKASLPGGGADPYLAIQVHTYDPWSFCGQTGKNSAWPGAGAIVNGVGLVAAHAKLLGVPINYGEFGVGRDANPEERSADVVREYYRTLRLAAISQNMSATVWDDRGWFGLVDKNASGVYDFVYYIVPSMMAP